MKAKEFVYLYVLEEWRKEKDRVITQKEIAKNLSISLSSVNLALKYLKKMNAIKQYNFGFKIIDAEKILVYFATIRDLERDIIWRGFSEKEVAKIEAEMPSSAAFTAYSAYKIKKGETPAEYSEVYAYCNEIAELKRRFKEAKKLANIFIMKKDRRLERFVENNAVAMPLIFADLWNMAEWYAKEFLSAVKKEILGE